MSFVKEKVYPQECFSPPNNVKENKFSNISIWNELKRLIGFFFPEVSESKNWFFGIIWLIIYVISFIVFSYQCKPLLMKYIYYDVSVSMSIEHANFLEFPQVTICKESIFEKQKIKVVTKNNLYQLAVLDSVQREYVKRVVIQQLGVVPPTEPCPDEFTKCDSLQQCIPSIWICDGTDDCNDASDESDSIYNCNSRTTGEFSACVGSAYRPCASDSSRCAIYCDGIFDCEDSSDEKSCVVSSSTVVTAKETWQFILSHPLAYTTNYDTNYRTVHIINGISDAKPYVKISFSMFDLEGNSGGPCYFDYVLITDGNGENITLCGTSLPAEAIYKAPVNVTFNSDYSVTHRGFQLNYISSETSERRRRSYYHNYFLNNSDHGFGSEYTEEYGIDIERELSIINKIRGLDWRSVYYKLREQETLDYSFASKFALFAPDVPHSYGVSLDDVVVTCKYGSANCASTRTGNDHFMLLMNAKYGKCYTFNSNKGIKTEKRVLKKSSRSGVSNGLSLVLFLQDDENIGFFNRLSGLSVTINPTKVLPLPHRNNIIVKPGTASRVSIYQKQINRLPHPYSKCTYTQPNWVRFKQINDSYNEGFLSEEEKDNLDAGSATFDDPHDIWDDYNQQVCFETCLYENLKFQCKCVDTYLYMYYNPEKKPISPFPICSPWNSTQILCTQLIFNLFRNLNSLPVPCNCPQSCSDKLYDMKVVSADFPSKNYLWYFIDEILKSEGNEAYKYVMKLMNQISAGNITEDELLANIKNNFLRIEIFFEEMNYERVKETPAYTFEQLLSAFAGNIGMFVGWSVLTFSQMLIFILNSIYVFFEGGFTQKNQ